MVEKDISAAEVAENINVSEEDLKRFSEAANEEGGEKQEVTEEAPEEQPEEEEAQQEEVSNDSEYKEDFEQEARLQGWTPQDKFKGNPKDWVDAETFVKRGREINAVLKDRNEKLLKKQEEQEQAIKNMKLMVDKMQERAKQDALEELKAKQKEALEAGDEELYSNLDKKRDNLDSEYSFDDVAKEHNPGYAQPEPGEPPEGQAEPPEVAAWKQKNNWFNIDRRLNAEAIITLDEVAGENPTMPLAEQLNEVTRRVKEAYPNKFGNPNKQLPPTVTTGQRLPGKGGVVSKKSWDDIPERDRDIAIQVGLAPATAKSKEDKAKRAGYVERYYKFAD